jgi:formate/nitrite transporter FocA (FNT family)
MEKVKTFKSAVISGLCIGIAGWGYLATMNIIGAVLFSFGLLAVVNYKLALYTGTAGFIKFYNDKGQLSVAPSLGHLLLILLGNVVGCLLIALLARLSPLELGTTAQGILEGRLAVGYWQSGILAIACGFIMTTIVTFARKGILLPMLFGIPLFIICGFPHSVADSFYYGTISLDYLQAYWSEILLLHPCLVLGNFIGCNLYRLIMGSNPE